MTGHTLALVAGHLVGVTLLVSGSSKLGRPDWPDRAADLGVARPVARAVPPVEIALGALLAAGFDRRIAASAAAAVLMAFTGLLALRLAQGRRPVCSCFGSWSRRPIGVWHLVRNAGLIGLALMAASYR